MGLSRAQLQKYSKAALIEYIFLACDPFDSEQMKKDLDEYDRGE